jgi:phosphoribosyl-ATP pyrophosphohydrolase
MTDATGLSDLEIFNLQRRASRKAGTVRRSSEPRKTIITGQRPPTSLASDTGTPVPQEPRSGIEPHSAEPGELDRLHRSLSEVTPENHPRTARLLASSTRKTAQKVIEEAGEVAIEAVKHHTRGIVRESADLLYHLVALWHRAGIDPADIWTEMRSRADTLGIAEKLPKARSDNRRPIRNLKPTTKTQQE